MKQIARPALLFFILFWTVITSVFDSMIIRDAVARALSLRYEPVECTIDQSEIVEQSDECTSYLPRLTYSYSVRGERFQGNRLYAGTAQGFGRARADRLTEVYPIGQKSVAYLDPNNPARAVLVRGFVGDELFKALFMTPFNLVMFGLWAAWIAGRRQIKSPRPAGGAKLFRNGNEVRARLTLFSPLVTALMALCGCTFVGVFVIGFTKGAFAAFPLVGTVWVIALSVAAGTYILRKRRQDSGVEDLIIHGDGERLTLPAVCQRKKPLTIERARVQSVFVDKQEPSDSDSSPQYFPSLQLKDATQLRLCRCHDGDQAEAFVHWLREELKSAQR